MDGNLSPTFISPSIQMVLGYTPEESLTLPLHRILTPQGYERIAALFQTVLADLATNRGDPGIPAIMELELIHQNGSLFPVKPPICP